MDKFFKNDQNLELTRKMLEIVNRTTDDFLFVMDIPNDTRWFFGEIDKEFTVRKPGSATNTTAELLQVAHPSDREALRIEFERIAAGELNVHNMDYRWINKNGETVWINCRARVIYDENGDPYIMIGRVSNEALRHLYNPLTGLWNRNKMREDLKQWFENSSGFLMLLDISGLSDINVGHGRKFGDELLKDVAVFLETAKNVEQVYHIDHNNFAVVIDTKETAAVENLYAEICEQMRERCVFSAGAVPIDKEVFIDVPQLIDSANITLNKAKKIVTDKVVFFSEEELQKRIRSLILLEELKQSIQNGFEGFELLYQPQVMGGNYELCGVEALLRYTSKKRGKVFPDEFIPILEQSRLIDEVGMWVLETALTQYKKWQKHLPKLNISVNFSAIQFEDRQIGEKVLDVLRKLGMPNDILTVELTESVQIGQNEQFANHMKFIRDNGIKFAIDDFGTGYSNLGHLKQLDVNEIKIDRSFVNGIEKDTYNYKLISNVAEFAKANNIEICCEGIETNKELAILEGLAPEKIQGFFFDKPLTPAEIEEKYINNSSVEFKKREDFIKKVYKFNENVGVLHLDAKNILRENDIGLWVIRINQPENRYELHTDETMDKVLGIKQKLTPAEAYDYWYSRVDAASRDYVSQNVNNMIEHGTIVQLKYLWHHPVLGSVVVRCSGRRVNDVDGMIILEGYHRILSDVEGV